MRDWLINTGVAVRWRKLVPLVLVMIIAWLCFLEARHEFFWRRAEAGAGKLRIGMTRNQVASIMGAPDTTSSNWHPDRRVETYCRNQPIPFLRDHYVQIAFFEGELESIEVFPDKDIPFDSADWKAAGPWRRGCMVNDLLRRVRLRGLARQQVLELFGPPDEPGVDHPKEEYKYNLGGRHGYDMDEDYLLFKFDAHGLASEISFVR